METDVTDLPKEVAEQYLHLYEKGKKHMTESEYQLAVDCFLEAMRITFPCTVIWNEIGHCYMKMGEYEMCIKALRRSLELDPNHVTALHNLSMMLSTSGEFEEAEHLIRKAIRLEPELPMLWMRFGLIFLFQELYNEARKAFERLCELEPENGEAFRMLGVSLSKMIGLGKAEKAFLRAKELQPNNPLTLSAYGQFLNDEERYEEAEILLREAIRLDPSNYVALVALADSLLHQALHNPSEKASGLPEVGEKVHEAHSIRPQYGTAWYVLANMATMLRDWDSAIGFGRRSIKLGYDDPAVYLCLSVALREAGKKTESKKVLEMYNKKDREKFARRFVDTVVKPKSVESRKMWIDRVINDFDYVMHEIIGVERSK